MSSEDLQAVYIEKLNAYTANVDFARLDRSCNSKNTEYAKEILKQCTICLWKSIVQIT
jgi:hypothetical protein